RSRWTCVGEPVAGSEGATSSRRFPDRPVGSGPPGAGPGLSCRVRAAGCVLRAGRESRHSRSARRALCQGPRQRVREMAGRKWMDYLNLAVNILVVLLVAGFMLRPGGPVGDWIAERRQRAAVEQQIRAVWPELSKGARVDDGPPAAKLVVLFSDYQCPGCRQAHFRIAELARETGVGVILRHTP